jgi:hypothetical protein
LLLCFVCVVALHPKGMVQHLQILLNVRFLFSSFTKFAKYSFFCRHCVPPPVGSKPWHLSTACF